MFSALIECIVELNGEADTEVERKVEGALRIDASKRGVVAETIGSTRFEVDAQPRQAIVLHPKRKRGRELPRVLGYALVGGLFGLVIEYIVGALRATHAEFRHAAYAAIDVQLPP